MAALETKRMSSIARRINHTWLRRLFFVMILLDILVLSLSVCGWCYVKERTGMTDWHFDINRRFIIDNEQPLLYRMDTAVYAFGDEIEGEYTADGGLFFQSVRYLFTIFLTCELALLLFQYYGGKARAKKLLTPLRKMTETAQELTEARFDEHMYHDLEDAIDKLSPGVPGAQLSTGNSDLQGLEEAVNSLILRMHAAYQQQIRFVSDASHELRTPIAVIQGYAAMLDRWGKNDEKILTESITAIKTESESMQKLVEQLLFLARGDSGRNKLTFETFDLTAMIGEVYDEYVMLDDKHEWRNKCDEQINAVGDVAMLKQTARILCDNAAKYTPQGESITLRTYIDEKGAPAFMVQDNGIGIPEGDIPQIFDRFFRSDKARTRAGGGTGLGLSIAKWIVDSHEGYFDVLSREQMGTRINVHLPKTDFSRETAGE